MLVFHIDPEKSKKEERAIANGEIWRQPITDEYSKTIRLGMVDFRDGAHTKMHTHDGDQILVIMEGEGLYRTETEEFYVKAGDVLLIPAGELHSHGAAPGKSVKQLGVRAVVDGNGNNTQF